MSDSPKLPDGWDDDGPETIVSEAPETMVSEQRELTATDPLGDWLAFYAAINPRITSKQTVRRYETLVNNFDRYLGRTATFEDLTPETYGQWVKSRRDSDRVAAGTVRGEAEKLLVLWRWIGKRLGEKPPEVALPAKSQKDPVAWLPAEIAKLDATARGVDWWVGGVPANLYWPALIGVAIETGERSAAIHALLWSDLDLAGRTVTFRAETRKGKTKASRKELWQALAGTSPCCRRRALEPRSRQSS